MVKLSKILEVYKPIHFYLTGCICFSIIIVTMFWSLFYNWSSSLIFFKIKDIAYIVFNFAITFLFLKMYKTEKGMRKELPDENINEFNEVMEGLPQSFKKA